MTKTAKVICAEIVEVGPESYTVRAHLGSAGERYHNGPNDFLFFTKEEAERLAERVNRKLEINLAYWNKGQMRPYAT
jgi:hypothetical protein